MIKYRLDVAKKYLDDAVELFNQKRYNSSVSRAYYASYQAMWAALGEPVEGKIWRHLAIIKHFVRGYWFAPENKKTGPRLLEDKRLPLRRLYTYRIASDYDAKEIDPQNLSILLKDVEQVVKIVGEKGGV